MNSFSKLASDMRRGKYASRKPPERDPRNRYKEQLKEEDEQYAQENAAEGLPPKKKSPKKTKDRDDV